MRHARGWHGLASALGDHWFPGRTAICIPDATRSLDPVPAALALAERCEHPRVVVGLGLHRRLTAAERAKLASLPDLHESDPDDVILTGRVGGIQGAITRAVAECDRAIAVSVVELHQYAGFSGGHKAVSVGCGGRATIAALHHRDVVTQPGVSVGQVADNPFRSAVDALGELAGCTHCLAWTPAAELWRFGDPTALIAESAQYTNHIEPVTRRYASAVFELPPSKGRSLYQASRAATYLSQSPHPPLLDGAVLRLHARLDEGLGDEAGFVAALRQHGWPFEGVLTGPPPTGAGAQRAVMLALLARRYTLELWGVEDPSPFRAVGITAFCGPPPEDDDTLRVSAPFLRLPQLR